VKKADPLYIKTYFVTWGLFTILRQRRQSLQKSDVIFNKIS